MNRIWTVVLSCEHGGNEVPKEYQYLFQNSQDILKTHRAYDIGAADLTRSFVYDEVSHCQVATTTRLLVDINRSLYRRTLFSEFTKHLLREEKEKILIDYYYAFRRPFEQKVRAFWNEKIKVLHVSVHSFTPELNGQVRQTDCGILYHPGREKEKVFAKMWQQEIHKLMPDFRVRFNYPYSGKPDGHVRHYRDIETLNYLGIEFELNQMHANNSWVKEKLSQSFKNVSKTWLLS